jgi:dihydroorotate dehydrogenase electron transfer subunit
MPLLRIPLSVAAVDEAAGIIDVIYEAVGPKTRVLSRLSMADSVACLGPLGNSFPAPRPQQQVVLVGGGVGLPPLLFFAKALTIGGHEPGVDLLVGARTASKHLSMDRLQSAASSVAIATDDGSAGHAGLVTDLLEQRLAAAEVAEVIVYTCGPHPMMRAVASICAGAGVPCFASLEEYMACGYGVCVGCVVETHAPDRDRSEYERYSRICVDGPVYDAAQIVWD